jgi:hypothetical protein
LGKEPEPQRTSVSAKESPSPPAPCRCTSNHSSELHTERSAAMSVHNLKHIFNLTNNQQPTEPIVEPMPEPIAGTSGAPSSSVQPSRKRKRRGTAALLTKRIRNSQNLTHLFESNEIVAQNNKFQLEIVKTQFSHNNRFSLDDHLFVMQCKLKNKKRTKPALLELLNLLYNGLINALDKMKNHYKNPEHEYQIYSTVIENHIKNGLNTGKL